MGVGLNRLITVEESPSLPSRLSPQQCPAPRLVIPQVRKYPALIVSNCRLVRTRTGNLLGVVLESPSSPITLLPQQYVATPRLRAHECVDPAATTSTMSGAKTSKATLASPVSAPDDATSVYPRPR